MKLLVILTICAACLDLIGAKSNSESNEEPKGRLSSKYNSISTTPKPESQYLSLQQHQQQQQQQQYKQNYPQHPSPPQYQISHSQPQRQLFGHTQQVFVQPAATYQPQITHSQLQQAQLQAAYQAQLQAQHQPQLQQQVIQKAYIVPQQHNRPAAMILIAQPTYVPQHVVYAGAPQQVYLQGAPQARYQIANSQNQHQIAQQVPAHSIGNYQVVAVPQYQQNLVAVPGPVPQATHVPHAVPVAAAQPQVVQQPSPMQLAHIAQIAAQQYARINPSLSQQQVVSSYPYTGNYQSEARASQTAAPIRSIPPIITGFENFTPEQQEKIKVQLSAYFGAPLRPLDAGGNVSSEKEAQSQEKEGQYSSSEFVPSEQVKEDASASSSNVFKSHYARV